MSLDVDVASERARVPLSRVRIAEIARETLRYERVRHALVSITFMEPAAMARLNRLHLDHAGPTDVISFGFTRATPTDPVVGDIYICPAVAREHAKEHGNGVREEIARLVVHGILHVLGYEHPTTDARETSDMWRRQERLMRRLGARPGTRR